MPTDAEVAASPSVLSATDAATAVADTATLPPPGDARRDELKARHAKLMAEAEQLQKDLGIESVDPKALRIDNEIARFAAPGRDGSEIENPQPGFVYCWEQADIRNVGGGLWVTAAKSKGWQVVDGSMPEEPNRRHVDGTRRWGDTILMRIRTERFVALEMADRRRRLAIKEGVSVGMLEDAERRGMAKVWDANDPNLPAHIAAALPTAQRAGAEAARATMVSTMRQARPTRGMHAAELAEKRFTNALKTGTVPGMPAPR